jgi:hypothetical protein
MKRSLAALAVLLLPLCVQAAEPRVLKPTSKWTLDFADERCTLVREFGDSADRVRLQLDSFGPTQRGYRVMLSGTLVPGYTAPPLPDFQVRYSPDTRARERFTALAGKFGEDNAVSFRQGFLPAPPPPASGALFVPQLASASRTTVAQGEEFERNVTDVTFVFPSGQAFRLDTGSMAEPFQVMHQCVDNLLTSWGIDPAVHRTLTRLAQVVDVPDGTRRISAAPNAYPGYTERALRRVVQGSFGRAELVPSRLMIDADGKPTACVVQVPVNEASRKAICGSFADYRFLPALDAQGRPVASFILFESR